MVAPLAAPTGGSIVKLPFLRIFAVERPDNGRSLWDKCIYHAVMRTARPQLLMGEMWRLSMGFMLGDKLRHGKMGGYSRD